MTLLARFLVCVWLSGALCSSAWAQEFVRQCIDVNDQGEGLELVVDGLGVIHFSHATRVAGNLRYTRIEVDGTVTHEAIANRIHRFPTTETLGTGFYLGEDEALVCFHNQLSNQILFGRRAQAGWQVETYSANAPAFSPG